MTLEESNRLDLMKKLIREAGTDELGAEFHFSVLKKIEALPKTNLAYEPVISSLAWKLILMFITGIFVGSFLFLPSNQKETSLFDKLPPLEFPTPSFHLYSSLLTIDFSPPFLIGIVTFFILGFIVIVGTLRNKQVGT